MVRWGPLTPTDSSTRHHMPLYRAGSRGESGLSLECFKGAILRMARARGIQTVRNQLLG